VDNNCNGLIDEDYTSTPTFCGLGSCGSTGLLECIGGSEIDSCVPGPPAGTDNNCNGIDENCDGVADNNYIPTSTSCGSGGCDSYGQMICSGGSLTNTCEPKSPKIKMCDGWSITVKAYTYNCQSFWGSSTECWDKYMPTTGCTNVGGPGDTAHGHGAHEWINNGVCSYECGYTC